MSAVMTKTIGDITIEIHSDEHCNIEDVLCDEPVIIYRDGRHNNILFDNSKTINNMSFDMVKAIDNDDIEDICSILDYDCEILIDGRVKIANGDRPRYFKNVNNAISYVLRDSGIPTDIIIKRVHDRYYTYYMVYSSGELGKYAGCSPAVPPIETFRYYLDGDVYGYIIKKDDEEIESVWGFIGDVSDCMNSAIHTIGG